MIASDHHEAVRSRYRLLGQHSRAIEIDASPEFVFDLVADVVRTAEYSPECRQVNWIPPNTGPAEGAKFRGQNRRRPFPRWWREARITKTQPGREFAFETLPGRGPYNDTTIWTYVFESTPAGTRVTESAELHGPRWIGVLDRLTGGPRAIERNIETSLTELRSLAERTRD